MMSNQLTLEATHLGLRSLGEWLDDVFERAGWVESTSRGAIELAVHELATNVVDHANPPDGIIVIGAAHELNQLTVTTTDTGTPFDESAHIAPDPDVPQVRGYGLMIAEQVADSVRYERIGTDNVWTTRFTVEP